MVAFSVEAALIYLDGLTNTITKKQTSVRLRAEVIITARTTPNNIFIAVCNKKINYLYY
jgi:hypothetical protein